MLSDRHYMRDREPRDSVSMLTWVIVLIIAGFLVELTCQNWLNTPAARLGLELSPAALRAGHLWTLFTYALLQDPGSLLGLLGNLLCIYFFGRAVLPLLGSRRFAWFCIAAVVVGGLAWAATFWSIPQASLIGASTVAVALLVLFACFNPDEPITFLLFFVLPVTVRPKYLALFTVAVDGVGFLFYNLPHHASPLGIAHAAHLGGALTAWIYFRHLHDRAPGRFEVSSVLALPGWLRLRRRAAAPPSARPVTTIRQEDLRAEVDRILDKINSDGFGALTVEERRALDDAKTLLSRR
jgi:membrane associated rhomboid family serine protease